MLSASCPSCGAPLVFRAADATAAVCEACRSVVVREGLRDLGKIAPFVRDLSPLQVGATGRHRGSGFRVVGVVRLGRERVRWNEWALMFEDGAAGWLAEGNEIWQIFLRPPEGQTRDRALPAHSDLRTGLTFAGAGRRWEVIEAATATIRAAEGELPYAPTPGVARPYADLRERPGEATGTLDYEDPDQPVLWVGEAVDLASLKMEGLRPFTGWSDPVLTAFAGPELTGTRALQCSGCGAGLTLRAPGQSAALTCGYCGTAQRVSLDGEEAPRLSPLGGKDTPFKPTLPLGTRGTLDEIPWEILGAQLRSVRVDGARYAWTEYLLHNPYRGFRWLVEDPNGHWSLVERLVGVPALARTGTDLRWEDETWRHFQAGRAVTERVTGEFTWEIGAGDEVETDDYVSPPRMLSRERTPEETTWSCGTWLPADEVAAGFGRALPNPRGTAPHQPNPFASPKILAETLAIALIGLGLVALLWVAQSIASAQEPLFTHTWTTSAATTDLWLDGGFTVPETERRNLEVSLSSDLDRDAGEVHVALLHASDGSAWFPTLTGEDNFGSDTISDPNPGPYQVRVEVAKDPNHLVQSANHKLTVTVVRDVPWRAPLLWTGLLFLITPILLIAGSGAFEKARWENSDHAE